MTASVWNPGASSQVLSNLNRISQEFTALVGQTSFTLLITPYTPGAQNLEVFKNGEKLLPSVVTEVTGGASFIIAACAGGEKIEAVVYPSTSNVFTTLASQAQASAAAAAVSAASAAASLAGLSQFTGAAINGNLNFVGTGNRIKGDFNNATHAARTLFETATGSSTYVGAAPSQGAGLGSGFIAYHIHPATLDGQFISIESATIGTPARLRSGATGAAPFTSLALNVGGVDAWTLGTAGDVTHSYSKNGTLTYQMSNTDAGAGAYSRMMLTSNAGSLQITKTGTATPLAGGTSIYNTGGPGVYLGTTDGGGVTLVTNNAAAAAIDSNGQLLLTKATGGLGYGAGAGGAVTQTTSRTTTTPAINRPNGDITLFTAAGSATAATFTVPNNLVGIYDDIRITTRGGTNKYLAQVTNIIANTSFDVTFQTTGGTATDTPIFHFSIGKGSNA